MGDHGDERESWGLTWAAAQGSKRRQKLAAGHSHLIVLPAASAQHLLKHHKVDGSILVQREGELIRPGRDLLCWELSKGGGLPEKEEI